MKPWQGTIIRNLNPPIAKGGVDATPPPNRFFQFFSGMGSLFRPGPKIRQKEGAGEGGGIYSPPSLSKS